MVTDGRRRTRVLLWLATSALIGACSSTSPTTPSASTAPIRPDADALLSERWRTTGLPATTSLFVHGDHLVSAGEVEAGSRGSSAIAVVDLATGGVRWSHPLRVPGTDPEAVEMRSEILRIVDTGDAVFLASFTSGNGGDPIVGFDAATGVRRFPPADQIDAYRVAEDLAGATSTGLVSNVGIVRDRVTGTTVRYKPFSGFVLGVAGEVGFAWSAVAPTLVAYDTNTDVQLWTTPVTGRPNIIVLDAGRVVVADDASWRLFDVASATATDLALRGRVNELSTVVACSTNTYRSISVGQSGTPATCDGRFVAHPNEGVLEVADLTTGTSVAFEGCDADDAPFAVADGLVLCSIGQGSSRLSMRAYDATTGLQIGKFADDSLRSAVGMAMGSGVLVVVLADGTTIGYDVRRPVTG